MYTSVWLDDGTQVQNCLLNGVGDDTHAVSEYISTVFYHTNSPKWRETFKVDVANSL